MIYTIRAADEFGRIYHIAQVLTPEELEYKPDWVFQYWFRRMVQEILTRMGADAWAEWTCREEEWGWWNG